MDLEKMMDVIVGDKIKRYRKSQNLTQEAFCEQYINEVSIDKYRLSALENGRRNENKNPNFLTSEHEEFFSKLMNIEVTEFCYGSIEEKHRIIKLILLNIFMNGTTQTGNSNDPKTEQSPIFDLNMTDDKIFFRLAFHNLEQMRLKDLAFDTYNDVLNDKKLGETVLQDRKQIFIHELQSYDSFFYSYNNARYYDFLMDGSQCFSKPASIILKSLFGDFEFANEFLTTTENLESFHFENLILRANKKSYYIDNYLRGIGNFGAQAIDWKEIGYKCFIHSFNEFYNNHAEIFLEFFEQNLFQYPYRGISNKQINLLFQSEYFLNILNEIYESDQYLLNRMLGHNFTRAMIQKFSLIEHRSKKLAKLNPNFKNSEIISPSEYYDVKKIYIERRKDVYDLDKYLYDFENMTTLFADERENDKRAGMFLPEYFDITPLK